MLLQISYHITAYCLLFLPSDHRFQSVHLHEIHPSASQDIPACFQKTHNWILPGMYLLRSWMPGSHSHDPRCTAYLIYPYVLYLDITSHRKQDRIYLFQAPYSWLIWPPPPLLQESRLFLLFHYQMPYSNLLDITYCPLFPPDDCKFRSVHPH